VHTGDSITVAPILTLTDAEEEQLAAWADEQLALDAKRAEAATESATATAQGQIDVLDPKIDAFVYALYGLIAIAKQTIPRSRESAVEDASEKRYHEIARQIKGLIPFRSNLASTRAERPPLMSHSLATSCQIGRARPN